MRLTLTWLIGMTIAALLLMCSASAAGAEATNAAAQAAPADTGIDDLMGCVASRTLSSITVGRNHRVTLVLQIGRKWECGCKQSLCDWDFSIWRRDPRNGHFQANTADHIEQESCPALWDHVKLLPIPRHVQMWAQPPANGVAVGPLFIEDPFGIFRLRSEHDRLATETWLRGTLLAVRSCWNNEDGGSHPLADRFYAAIGL